MSAVVTDSLRGFTATVDSAGSLQTKVAGTVDVAVQGGVETSVAALTLSTANRGVTVATSSGQLCSATSGRQSIYFSNNGANAVHIRFGTDAATTDDFLLAAGAHVTFERVGGDAVQAIAVGASSRVAVIEWKV